MTLSLITRSILLGVGLAMDAFSVSLADGLAEPNMKKSRRLLIAGVFAVFQFVMPVIGWVLVRTAVSTFGVLEKFIPWAALILLSYIGGKMLVEGIRDSRAAGPDPGADPAASADPGTALSDPESGADLNASELTTASLVMQGIATSIDALSVGFTIESYALVAALASSLIIGAVTLVICLAGLFIGRKAGTLLSGKASVLGGLILIAIGIEIWL